MNITANLAGGAYWTTFYHKEKDFIAPMGTQVFIVKLNSTTKEITLAEIPNRIVKSDEAVVLKQPTTGNEAKNTIVMAKIAADSYGDFSGNSLHGTIAAVSHLINVYVLNNGSHGVGFYKISNQGTLGANKGYLVYSGTTAPEFFGFDETTNITTTNFTDYTNSEEWYNLNGRKVSGKPTNPGLYIHGGRKVVIK